MQPNFETKSQRYDLLNNVDYLAVSTILSTFAH